jgi:hypothetical protein
MRHGVALGGADVFHLINDRAMRAAGLASNQCAYVLALDGRIEPSLLQRRAARAEALVPELCFRLAAGPLRLPAWVPAAPRGEGRVRVLEVEGDDPTAMLADLFAEPRTHEDRTWEISLLRGPSRDSLVLLWFHPLTDARGAERLVRWLGSGEGDLLEAPPPPEERMRVRPQALERLDTRGRLELARAYNTHILGFAQRPVLSLRGASPSAPLGSMRFVRLHLSTEETTSLDRSIRARAKLAESSVMLLSATRAVDHALRRRGFAPTQLLVPVPLSLDPKAERARMLGNHLTMMMFSLDRDDLADERRALASIAEQQRAIVRDKLDLGMAAALELVRVLPAWAYLGLATLPFHGELSSLILSNPGPISLDRFAGVRIIDAFPVPAVVPRPGIEVIWSRHGGRLSAILGYLDGLVAPREAEDLVGVLREALFGEPTRPSV